MMPIKIIYIGIINAIILLFLSFKYLIYFSSSKFELELVLELSWLKHLQHSLIQWHSGGVIIYNI